MNKPLKLPPFKLKGDEYTWLGRLIDTNRLLELPVLWFKEGMIDYSDGFNAPFYVGKIGRVAQAKVIRKPSILIYCDGPLYAALIPTYQNAIDKKGVIIAGGLPVNSDGDSMTNFIPYRDFNVPADPKEYVGGTMFYIGSLTEDYHYKFSKSSYNWNIPYNIYQMSTITRTWTFVEIRHLTGHLDYLSNASPLPALATDTNTVKDALKRFDRVKYTIGVQKDYAFKTAPISVNENFYVGPSPPAVGSISNLLYYSATIFGDAPTISNVYYATYNSAHVVDEKAAWDKVFEIAQATAVNIGDIAEAKRYDNTTDLLSDITTFFHLI